MRPQRARTIVSLASMPVLKSHARLQFDPVRGAWALLSPEKVFWPDEVSLDILKLCDGTRSVAGIIRLLAEQYDAREKDIGADVETFLQEWADRFLVTL